MELAIIAAMGLDNTIGIDGALPWHLPDDLKRFKEFTTGNTILMGRKTFESLPNGALPNRRNLVVSRNPDYVAEGAETFGSVDAALEACGEQDKVFICGGGEVYTQTIDRVNTLHLTYVGGDLINGVKFPELDAAEWSFAEAAYRPADVKHCQPRWFASAVRIKKK